ncbi:MAG: CHAT domain-containing protein, partial [Terracidiphilus sp.]
VIVPDGFLAMLPFEALNTAETGDPAYLTDAHSITYTQSASVLTWTRKFSRAPAKKTLFALADPIFSANDPRLVATAKTDATSQDAPRASTPTGLAFRRLPETETEVETLAAILGVEARPPDVLVGTSATKATLQKTDLSAYRYLHFATHAAALGQPGRVNEPFLVLNQTGNQPGDNGLLTMSEIMGLKLSSELVVLGACDTGVGDVLEGDGVASLASAFQFAGAESVVLSLWELPSEATLPFMRAFYQELKLGNSKVDALQSGRDAMRRLYPDPYYWAVFALYSGASP